MERIEKSGFRRGEYVGYTPKGIVRIRKSRIGWEVYALGNNHSQNDGAKDYIGFQRKTLRELDELFAREAEKERIRGEINVPLLRLAHTAYVTGRNEKRALSYVNAFWGDDYNGKTLYERDAYDQGIRDRSFFPRSLSGSQALAAARRLFNMPAINKQED
jgi:hypothetical protein